MAPPRLPKLPSIGELIEHPRVKHLVSRINRSTLAQRATGFLEDVGASMAKRADDLDVPSLSSLAERFAHLLLGEARQSAAVVNATGVVVGAAALQGPLAEAALQAALFAASEYHDDAASDVERSLQALAGVGDVVVTHSVESAVRLVLSEWTSGGDVGVARGDDVGDQGCLDWQSLAVGAGVALRPIDETARLELILRSPEAGLTREVELSHADLPTLRELAEARGAALVDVSPLAGFADPVEFSLQSIPTIRARLEAGCDIVVADGAGLLGGPSCGIIFSAKPLAAHATMPRAVAQHRAHPLTRIALGVTVGLYNDQSPPVHQAPIWQLLSAPIDNLKQRAARLARLLAEADGIDRSEPVESAGVWCRCGNRALRASTWMVRLHTTPGSASLLRRALADRTGGISVRLADVPSDEGDVLHLDLRSVFPRWDQSLVEAVEQA